MDPLRLEGDNHTQNGIRTHGSTTTALYDGAAMDMHPQRAVTAIDSLHMAFLDFCKNTDHRMSRMESQISQILEVVSRSQDNHNAWTDMLSDHFQIETPVASTNFYNSPPSQPLAPLPLLEDMPSQPSTFHNTNANQTNQTKKQQQARLVLKPQGLETKWYTKRPMAPFQVQLIDSETGQVFKNSSGFVLFVHLLSGYGLQVDHFLGSADTLQFPLVDGQADVTGLRFLAVSSRNGGYFNLQFSATGPMPVQVTLSDEMHILSERLKNEHKAESILDLCADDSLVRVPGIGKKYATKLAEQGLQTVRDLALVDTAPDSRFQRLNILNAVRKERGALTEAKLVELLRDAKAVVKREELDAAIASRPTKRARVESPTAIDTSAISGSEPSFQFSHLKTVELFQGHTTMDANMMINFNSFEDTMDSMGFSPLD